MAFVGIFSWAKPDTIVPLLEGQLAVLAPKDIRQLFYDRYAQQSEPKKAYVAEFLEAEYLRDKAGVRDALFGHVPKGAKPKGP